MQFIIIHTILNQSGYVQCWIFCWFSRMAGYVQRPITAGGGNGPLLGEMALFVPRQTQFTASVVTLLTGTFLPSLRVNTPYSSLASLAGASIS